MKKLLICWLCISALIAGTSCTTQKEVSASGYISQLETALKKSDLPSNDFTGSATSTEPGNDLELGDYIYSGYIVTDGVYASTYEDETQTKLLRAQIMIDLSLARREDLSSGAFALYNMLAYFDGEDADKLSDGLSLDDITSRGISEESSKTGAYKFLVDPNKTIFLIYTPADKTSTK